MKYNYIMPPKEPTVEQVVRIYEPKSKVFAERQMDVFPVEIKRAFIFRRIIREKFEDVDSSDLPQHNRLGGIIGKNNSSRSSHFRNLADHTEDVYEKIVFLNRALDYDVYNADRTIAIVEYYRHILAEVSEGRMKVSASALATLKKHLEYYEDIVRVLRPSYFHKESSAESSAETSAESSAETEPAPKKSTHRIVPAKHASCMFPILYDTDVQKRVELNTWVLSNSTKFPEFIKNNPGH